MRSVAIVLLASCLALAASGCAGPAGSSPSPASSPTAEEPAMSLSLTSTAFTEGGAIPRVHACDGDDLSPPLAWSGVPDGTVSLALVLDDPDAGGFVHWLVYAIDPAAGSLPEGVSGVEGEIAEGINSFGNIGYGGPCPPSGTHRYDFRLLALDVNPTFSGPPEASALEAATAGRILGEATLRGAYRRGG